MFRKDVNENAEKKRKLNEITNSDHVVDDSVKISKRLCMNEDYSYSSQINFGKQHLRYLFEPNFKP